MDFPEIHKPRVVVFPFYNSDVVKNGPFHKRSDVYAPARPRTPSSYTTAREVRRSRSLDGADASMQWPASSVAGKRAAHQVEGSQLGRVQEGPRDGPRRNDETTPVGCLLGGGTDRLGPHGRGDRSGRFGRS